MKKTIIVMIISCFVFGAYVLAQNATKNKKIEPCCCKHTQQIAEDLHWIREQMSKPYVPREIPTFKIPELPDKPEKIEVPDLTPPNLVPPDFNFRTPPKIPKR